MKSLTAYPAKTKLCLRTLLLITLSSLLFLGGCASAPKTPEGAIAARARLTQLQNDPSLAGYATVAIQTADVAVTEAEVPRKDKELSDHLVLVADREVDAAWTQAQTKKQEQDRAKEANANERVAALTLEADQAHEDNEELRRLIAELNAQATERGIVITLGDTLFETGKAQLKGEAFANLTKLANYLKAYPNRTLTIEGHTDNVGTLESNLTLSQQRAESVYAYLVEKGVNHNRIGAYGKGESAPVASNDTASGRTLNRRVEVIIANPPSVSTK